MDLYYYDTSGAGRAPVQFQSLPSNGTWIHFTVTFDGTEEKIFLNGVLQGKATLDYTIYSASLVYEKH